MKQDKTIKEGDTICIAGGGPGGSSCAIYLLKEAKKIGLDIKVVIFEQKMFEQHRQYNQCIGVLSPPFENILYDNLSLKLPDGLKERKITQYRLHSDNLSCDLIGEESGASYAVKRSQFDAFLLEEAKKHGACVLQNRVTGAEFHDDGVMIYSDGDNCKCSVMVGAFGLDEGACKIFEEATPYRQPDHLNTIIARLYPGEEFLKDIGPTIQAFLLSFQGLEFGAITPKDDHISINIAGRKVTYQTMLDFLRSSPVQRFLPPQKRSARPLNYFRGRFPISPAKNLYGDRYVMIGDAAGLIRPFKGKGINSACLTGVYAAKCILNSGFSREAFSREFAEDCREFTDDLPYGKAMRFFANSGARLRFMDRVLKVAMEDKTFMACMFNCVTGHKSYKEIILETASIRLGFKFLSEIIDQYVFNRKVNKN